MATILNRLVTWICLSGSRNQIEIEADPRHREILLAEMNLDGANVKSVTTPAMKMQEWRPQMLTMLDKGSASTVQQCDDANELHVYQPHGSATSDEEGCMVHGRTEWRTTRRAVACNILSAHSHRHDDFFQPFVSSAKQHMYLSHKH